MSRILTQFNQANFTYAGQKQDSKKLNAGGRYAMLDILIEGQADTTTGTLYPHFAQVANCLDLIEVADNNNRSFLKISGSMAYAKFNQTDGYTGDHVSLPGGANTSNAAFRCQLSIPFELDDGANPMDTLLQSVEKDLTVTLTYANPATAGVFFGDPTGFNLDSLSVKLSLKEYRLRETSDIANATPLARKLIEIASIPITQTADDKKVELPTNGEYRGVYLVAEHKVNGVWVPENDIIDMTKKGGVYSTKGDNTYRSDYMRVWRNDTVRARRNASLIEGVIDFNLLPHGRINGTIVSNTLDELFLQLPVVKQAGDTRLRVLADTIATQGAGN